MSATQQQDRKEQRDLRAPIANRRFKALAKLDTSAALRKELRKAGVPASTIDSLYPFNFADLIDGLIPLVGPKGLSEIVSASTFNALDVNVRDVLQHGGGEVLALLHESHTAELNSKISQLAIATMRNLPEQEAEDDSESKKEVAELLVTLLWYATFYVAHIDKVACPKWWVRKNFIDITDLIFAEQFPPKEAAAWS